MARILFVDDDPFTLEMMAKAAQVIGHAALSAQTGKSGFNVAQQETPDLIFVDRSLPDMDGLALAGMLNQDSLTHNIPVLMLSAGPEADAAQLAKTAGAREYLPKPIRLQKLMDVIQQYT